MRFLTRPLKQLHVVRCCRLTQCTFSPEDSTWIAADGTSASFGSRAIKSLMTASDKKEFAEAHGQLVDTCIKSK